jgi:hypothetical protein
MTAYHILTNCYYFCYCCSLNAYKNYIIKKFLKKITLNKNKKWVTYAQANIKNNKQHKQLII